MSSKIETRVLHVDSNAPAPDIIQIAAETLRAGGLVAFPTETVYGLGANALDETAINRIYAAKNRPSHDPIIAHIYSIDQLDTLAVNIPAAARQLAQAFWPGPLTLVLKRAPQVPANIAAGLDTIAVRMPGHPVARALLKAAQIPVAAPSANTFTRPSSTTAEHVLNDLQGQINIVLDGGASTIGLESTVIDLSGELPTVLRPGGVVVEDLRRMVPSVKFEPKQIQMDKNTEPSVSPGMLSKHYSPRASVMLFDGPPNVVIVAMCDTAQRLNANGKRVGILSPDDEADHFTELGARIIALGQSDDIAAIGRVLFGAMRALDSQGVDTILVHSFGHEGLGAAIWDRLLRAAEGQVIRVNQ